jgi:hypothetical protein
MGTLVVVAAVVITLALGGPDEKTREAGERMASRAFMTAIFEGWSTPEEAGGEANMERRAREKCEELAWEVYFVGDDYVGPEQIDREAAAGVCTDTVMELLLMPVGP